MQGTGLSELHMLHHPSHLYPRRPYIHRRALDAPEMQRVQTICTINSLFMFFRETRSTEGDLALSSHGRATSQLGESGVLETNEVEVARKVFAKGREDFVEIVVTYR